jgi:methylmalonyl-CoA mutase N-terminal domain/subunit
MVRAIELGYPQREIEESAYQYQRQIESGDLKIVGVNVHLSGDKTAVTVQQIDPELERDQLSRLAQFKSSRDQAAVSSALASIDSAARSPSENLLPLVIEAVDCGATLGEISHTLRGVYGEFGT